MVGVGEYLTSGIDRVLRAITMPKEYAETGEHVQRMIERWLYVPAECLRCGAVANMLDSKGPGWTERHIDHVVAKLKHNAYEAGMPFLDSIARKMVKRAIRLCRRDRLLRDNEIIVR